ncbi:MAG: dihydrofolate reductase [Bacteroidales bacterium]
MSKPEIIMICAVDNNMGIGKDNDMLFYISEDLKRFKQLTSGQAVVMGRKCWESLPKRPLPNRENIVMTTNTDYKCEGGILANSVEQVLAMTKDTDKVFIIGGAQIYKLFMPYATSLLITEIDNSSKDADVFFPDIDMNVWKIADKSEINTDANQVRYRYVNFKKRADS